MPGTQFPALIQLSSLNGLNGFKIDGENKNDGSGCSVSGAGDVNGDGYDDLIIGAQSYRNGTASGRSYVIFGRPGIGGNGLFNLLAVNGSNGFKLDGENTADVSGASVSRGGDINGDGYDDLLVGAFGYPSGSGKGRSYVIFGGRQVGSSGVILLSSLNGTNGFRLDGETNLDYSGSVSSAGDFNKDGYGDLVIGAFGYGGSHQGRAYLVFGGAHVGSSGAIALSSLDGNTGIRFDGEGPGAYTGASVRTAGDITGDGYDDLLIGAYAYPSSTIVGRTYIVYGGANVAPGGYFSLTNINTVGFKLDGENVNEYSGLAISTAGDINGDGRGDLMIGAFGHPMGGNIGRSYVIFGGPANGYFSGISLSNLNGANGFKVDGESINDWSGYFVSMAGDINDDGHPDLLIGAPQTGGSAKGRSYVVFGGPGVGSSSTVLLSSLNGGNGFRLDGENDNDSSGMVVSGIGDINGDGISDLIIGAAAKDRSYVVFGDRSPQLLSNQLTIQERGTTVLTQQNLNVTDNAPVSFSVSNIQHGHFEFVSAPGVGIVAFNQSQLEAEQVQFVHDGSEYAPSYSIAVINSGIALSLPAQAANITYIPVNDPPVVTQMIQIAPFKVGDQIDILIPSGTFTDPDPGDTLHYSASLQDGTALPGGRLFFADPPPTLSGLITQPAEWNILIKATDSGGLSANTSFSLQVIDVPSPPCSVPKFSSYSSDNVVCSTMHGLIIGIPSALGTIGLAMFGIWARRRAIEKTWSESRYGIHNQLRKDLKLEIGRAVGEERYSRSIFKLMGAILDIPEEEVKRRDSQYGYGFKVGERIAAMTQAEKTQHASILSAAIREHIYFPKLYCDSREVKEKSGVRLEMPIFRYFNAFIPNPFSCMTTYEFRPDVLAAAFDDIVQTAKENLGMRKGSINNTGKVLTASPSIHRGSGSSVLFREPAFSDKSSVIESKGVEMTVLNA